MPSINDIVQIAESLEAQHVVLDQDRCVRVRNRNSSCTRCMDACTREVITIENNQANILHRECVACGACVVACPSEALLSLEPTDDAFANALTSAMDVTEGAAVIACARIASKREGASEKFVEVPCLARVDEHILLMAASLGATEIACVDGECKTCKYRREAAGCAQIIATTNELLAAQGSDLQVERRSSFPEAVLADEEADQYGVSRRGFFTQMGSTATNVASKTATTMLKNELPEKKPPTLRERLAATKAGTLPQIRCTRHDEILDALDRLGQPQVETYDTRLFGRVEIDVDECTSCGMCAVFCTTGALKRVSEDEADIFELEFSASDCIQCRLCEDSCLAKVLTVNTQVPTAEIFDFEPRSIRVKNTAQKTTFHTNWKKGLFN